VKSLPLSAVAVGIPSRCDQDSFRDSILRVRNLLRSPVDEERPATASFHLNLATVFIRIDLLTREILPSAGEGIEKPEKPRA
jgi:hypothetical protein